MRRLVWALDTQSIGCEVASGYILANGARGRHLACLACAAIHFEVGWITSPYASILYNARRHPGRMYWFVCVIAVNTRWVNRSCAVLYIMGHIQTKRRGAHCAGSSVGGRDICSTCTGSASWCPCQWISSSCTRETNRSQWRHNSRWVFSSCTR